MILADATPEQAGLHPERLQHLKRWLELQVEHRRVAGASLLLARGGRVGFRHHAGQARLGDAQGQAQPFARDTLVRLYSMTKPVTAVAAMMLHEQGHFQLDDPVAWYLPAFADTPVWDGTGFPGVKESGSEPWLGHTVAQQTPMTIRHLMTHTAGLSYSFMHASPVDNLYRERGLEFPGGDVPLAELVDRLAQVPLLYQPGTRWHYSVASDVLGRLVEVWSGQSLADYCRDHVFDPLAMHDTGFQVQAGQQSRLADLLMPAEGGSLGTIGKAASAAEQQAARMSTAMAERTGYRHAPPSVLESGAQSSFLQHPTLYSGGGGLVGTIDDYARFLQMLLNGGELDGERLLAPATVAFMRRNHLPGQGDMASLGQAQWSESSYEGVGFGLGFAVVMDPVKAQMISSVGECHWGGAASTFFWIDPVEQLQVIFLTQLLPSSSYPIRRELRTAVYQAALALPSS